MAPRKGTKAWRSQTKCVFYGIELMSLTVRSVWMTNDGRLLMMGDDGAVVSHQVAPGREAWDDVILVFHLADIVTLPVARIRNDHPAVLALEERARQWRARREERERLDGG